MLCNWDGLLAVLPGWMGKKVDEMGRESLQELRLRLGERPELILGGESRWLDRTVSQEDISYCINGASRFSPWASQTVAKGYLTAEGGHRIGLCGQAVCQSGKVSTLRQICSLCIRVARDYPGVARGIPDRGSVLILGAPGWGKTTLLRDLIRNRGKRQCVGVVDERMELFPQGLSRGNRVDVLTGMEKGTGIIQLLRTMSPGCIAVDEITDSRDCDAMGQAANCGVELLATAHAGSMEEFRRREVYKPLIQNEVFDICVVLHRDKSWRMERMRP